MNNPLLIGSYEVLDEINMIMYNFVKLDLVERVLDIIN